MKLEIQLLVIGFVVFSCVPSTQGEKILVLTPLGSKSHKIFFMSIANALVDRGHEVTVVSAYFEPSQNRKNLRQVIVTNFNLDSIMSSVFNDTEAPIRNLMFNAPTICSDTLALQQIQNLKNEKFDLVILSMFVSQCYLSFVHHCQVPFIYMSSAGLMAPFNDMVQTPDFPSFVPSKMLNAVFPLSFKDRLVTTSLNFLMSTFFQYYVEPQMENICKERGLCPQDMSMQEIGKNASLAIINSVRSLEWPPRPVMPNVIYAGGAHIKPAKSLPKELEEFVSGSGEEGFIFFSLGSAVNPSLLPEKYRKILVKVFGSLKQRVLWKWGEKTMPDLPDNVKLSEWLPQRDLLGHPKIRVFITHGGLSSTMEATYHGVPTIGMPIFGDQYGNMKEAEREGWVKVMEWNDLEENDFRKLILETINDERLKKLIKRRSEMMKDTQIPPDQEAAYWVEYVIRHEGATHIKSPLRLMSWYEISNVDVYGFIVVVLLGVIYVYWKILACVLRFCCRHSKANENKRKKE